MKKLLLFGLVYMNTCAAAASAANLLPAFPGAEGFGAAVSGGRGCPVYEVTTLEDYLPNETPIPGSLRDALSKSDRTIVFRVGGVIRLKANLQVPGNITIAGQTAPGEGISLYGKSLSLSGQKNIIIRYIRCRQGIEGDRGKCSINIAGGSDIILDHLSIQCGRWDALGITKGSRSVTVQNCIIGEAIDPQRFGALVDSVENVTLSRNLWIHNQSRNPKAKGTIQYINNIVYNWGVTGLAGGHSAADRVLDVINNYLIAGPSSRGSAIGGFAATDHVYQIGNFVDTDVNGVLSGRPVVESDFRDVATFVKKRFCSPAIPVTEDSAEVAYQKVLKGAGASLNRDAVDRRLIADLASLGKQGKIVRSEAEVGGHPELKGGVAPADTDHDGMPDEWEKQYGLDPKDPSDGTRDKDGDGYTNLEEYLNNTDPTKALDYSLAVNNISSIG